MRYFLAGGAVRDLLLGRCPTEFDIVFDGSPEELERLHGPLRRVGKTTATYIVNGRDHMPLVRSIHEDLLARDCTINALLMDEAGVIHALPRTFEDLRDGIIRHASDTAFKQDPVRVFRAARFSATLPGFSLDPATMKLMRETAGSPEFHAMAAERVGRECMKAMAGPRPGNFPRTLAEANALFPWLAPFETGKNIPAGPAQFHGKNSVFDHILAVMDIVAARRLTGSDHALAVWMGFCHDLGKLTTPPDILPRHTGHEKRGAAVVNALVRRLGLPSLWGKAGCLAASLHMKAGLYPTLRPGTRVDLLHILAASRLFIPFCALVEADTGDEDIGRQMREDMERMLAVKLPAEWRNRGRESAMELRRRRIRALVDGASAGQKPHP